MGSAIYGRNRALAQSGVHKNMKNTLKSLFILIGLLAVTSSGFAQTILANTTLSATMPSSASTASTTGNPSIAVVASATGISAPTPNTSNTYGVATSEAQSYIYVDRELMEVRAVSSTTLTVIRAVAGTAGSSHASGAIVLVVPASAIFGGNARYGSIPQGSCTRANELFLPHIQFVSGVISDCLGGQWVNGDVWQTTRFVNGSLGLRLPDPGATALTALETAGTAAGAATEEYCTEIDLPYSMLLTGLGVLNGTTVGTDKHLLDLRDSSGIVVANSAVAGAVTAVASTYQKYNFTTPYFAVGPARYFGCMQANGTTDTVRHTITAVNNNVFAGKLTGQTFGTLVTATMPSTFTTALGPYYLLF